MILTKKKVKLTEKDKLTLSKYLNTCTDLHGNGCGIMVLNEKNKELN